MKVSSPSRCSVRCRLKSPAAIVSRQLTNANDTKAAITANMPYPNDWSAETVAALYKRVTWNIHGRKQIVWRCVNRLEYGTKFCSHSPSIPEEELHQAILKAVQNLAANFTDEVAAQLDGILRQMKAGETLKAQLQKQLEKAQQEFDRLLEMSLELDESTPFLDDKLRKLSGKIKILKANIAESTDGKGGGTKKQPNS